MKIKTLLCGMGGIAGVACCSTIFACSAYLNTYADNISGEVNITPSINVTIPTDTVTLNLAPTSTASFNSSNLSVTVSTNNPTGYTLTMSPSDSTSTSLTRTGGTETIPTLATLSGGYTEQTFTTNRWGYKLSSGNYLPFTTSNEINVTDNPSNASTNTVTFAAKADMSQASGAYTLEIAFTAVANYVAPPAHTIADGGNMQDVSSVADGGCPSTLTTGQVYTLTDNRGATPETYKVARLADGKCWMVENLNIAGGTTLSSADTDMPDGYTLPTANNFRSGNKLPASTTAGFDDNTKAFVYNSGNKTSNCSSPGCYSYYSWTAATLGSGLSISTDNTDAPYSICPKGWKLPSTYNGSGTAAAATDFRGLMIAYGGSDSIQTYDSSTSPTGATMYSKIGPGTTPNFLLAGGYSSGSFFSGGSNGLYWSATSNSSTGSARYLYFNLSYVSTANTSSRGGGGSVRCLLR